MVYILNNTREESEQKQLKKHPDRSSKNSTKGNNYPNPKNVHRFPLQ
jgi:hypothetical protein